MNLPNASDFPCPVQHTPNKKITCNLADRLAILRTLLLRAPVTMLVLYNVMICNSPTLFSVLFLASMGFVCAIIIIIIAFVTEDVSAR